MTVPRWALNGIQTASDARGYVNKEPNFLWSSWRGFIVVVVVLLFSAQNDEKESTSFTHIKSVKYRLA